MGMADEGLTRRGALGAASAGLGLAFAPTADAAEAQTTAGDLLAPFHNPPPSAGPGIYWYWLGGAVTREGITADLEAMAENGVAYVLMFAIGKSSTPPVVDPPADALTPYWWELVRHAVSEAKRVGLQIGMNICDGWATASGPWITPELSMQHVVWSETVVEAGRPLPPIPQPPSKLGYYVDVRTVAFPFPAAFAPTSARAGATVTSDMAGARPALLLDPANTEMAVDTDRAGFVQFAFAEPFTLRSVTVRTPSVPGFAPGVQRAANTLRVEASDDGETFRPVARLTYPQNGWQSDMLTLTHAVPPTTALVFRLAYTPEPAGPYREAEDFAGFDRLQLLSLELSSTPRIGLLPVKSGDQWGIAPRDTSAELPDADCVDPAEVIDLTARLKPDGTLDWTPPPHPHGGWKVLRIGATTTGSHNSAAGGAQGLECDKFNPDAAKLQFDRWFGEALRKVGPALGGPILHGIHVDSWEAGSQNWSPKFAAGFQRRRGYDLAPWLPVMAGVPMRSADQGERVLFDVRRTIGDLVQTEFFAVVSDLAHRNGCIFSGEVPNPTFPADGFRHFQYVDLPMGEFWLHTPRNDKPTDIKDSVNGARIYGKRWAGAESFTEGLMDFTETPWTFKALGDHNYCEGINRLMLHVYAAQPWTEPREEPGETLNGIGTFFSRTQTWWKPAKAWFDYLRRCQSLLQQGQGAADIAYFGGEDIPARSRLPYQLDPPLPRGYAYDTINRDALLRLARVEDGRLLLPSGVSYAVLVTGLHTAMSPDTARAIRRFVSQGLTVVGARPLTTPGAQGGPAAAAEVAAIGREVWGEGGGAMDRRYGAGRVVWGQPLDAVIGLPPDALFTDPNGTPADSVQWTHRRGPGFDLYFVSNQADEAAAVLARLRATGSPRLVSADTGRVQGVAAERDGAHAVLPMTLDPRGSVFVLFEAGAAPLAPPAPVPPLDIAVPGPWTVVFAERSGAPKTLRLDRLSSWSEDSDPDIRFFSGSATYTTTCRLPPGAVDGAPLWLDLGEVADLAEVRLNGREVGVAWKRPFRLDIAAAARPGENRLEVVVTNTWRNRLIGDYGKPAAERTTRVVPPLRKGREWLPGGPGTVLSQVGLLGPVRVVR